METVLLEAEAVMAEAHWKNVVSLMENVGAKIGEGCMVLAPALAQAFEAKNAAAYALESTLGGYESVDVESLLMSLCS